MNTTTDLAELRNSIVAGSYVIDPERVAGVIARKLAEIERVRRSLTADGRILEPAGSPRPVPAARPPHRG
jgi:uncharacterized protein YutE (UPF0331/DUF86 family)